MRVQRIFLLFNTNKVINNWLSRYVNDRLSQDREDIRDNIVILIQFLSSDAQMHTMQLESFFK